MPSVISSKKDLPKRTRRKRGQRKAQPIWTSPKYGWGLERYLVLEELVRHWISCKPGSRKAREALSVLRCYALPGVYVGPHPTQGHPEYFFVTGLYVLKGKPALDALTVQYKLAGANLDTARDAFMPFLSFNRPDPDAVHGIAHKLVKKPSPKK